MASNPPAPEAPFMPSDTFAYGAPGADEGPFEEWNPTAESVRPVRGRHRVAKQRGGGLARSSTVLGVGVIAAVGAGRHGQRPDRQAARLHLRARPAQRGFPHLRRGNAEGLQHPLSDIGMVSADTEEGAADAGEALRARIMAQVEQQQGQAQSKAQAAALAAAEKEAAEAAAKAEKEAKEKAEAAKKKAEEEARRRPRPSASPSWPSSTPCRPPRTPSPRPSVRPAPTGPPATTPVSTSPPPPAP